MGKGFKLGSSGSTADLDAITATAEDVREGKITVNQDGDPVVGVMKINSILSFSAQAYGGRQILLTWQNPYAAKGRPFSGVFVQYMTDRYPGKWEGTRIYTGYGNNANSGGWSSAVVTLPEFSKKYYFTCAAYATCYINGVQQDLHGDDFHAEASTQADIWLTFTASGSYTIPTGYSKMDVFAVGGGSSGASNGGSGGYTASGSLAITPGQTVNCIIGAGGIAYFSSSAWRTSAGGQSYITLDNVKILTADGGDINNGGSGGGARGFLNVHHGEDGDSDELNGGRNGGDGGADGSDGSIGSLVSGAPPTRNDPGKGQHTTTRAWGNPDGTLYAGGGGGCGDRDSDWSANVGRGGAGGGGDGGVGSAIPGTANTGGGGGGNPSLKSYQPAPANGGSGIVLIHIY